MLGTAVGLLGQVQNNPAQSFGLKKSVSAWLGVRAASIST